MRQPSNLPPGVTDQMIEDQAGADDDWDDEPCPDHCEDKVPLDGYYHCPVCDREWFPENDQ